MKTRIILQKYALLLLVGCIFFLPLSVSAQADKSSKGGKEKKSGKRAKVSVPAFRKITLTEKFYGEGIHHVDLDKDGDIDVISGPFIYQGPDFSTKTTWYEPAEFDPLNYSENYFMAAYDFNGDGHLDIFKYGRAGSKAYWYANPGNAGGMWKEHLALEAPGNEARYFTDLNNDGRPEAIFVFEETLCIGWPDWNNVEKPFRVQKISRNLGWGKFTHGLGVGDINGDGRNDILAKAGWWEQPANNADKGEWIEHAYQFSEEGGAQMLVYDVNADGKVDIITSLNAHGYGLAWFEQKRSGDEITFEKHMILGNREEFEAGKYPAVFSQLHTLALGDFNGDGLMDFASGKRYWAHGPKGDPEPGADPVLYWFELVRKGGDIKYIPHLVDNQSGAGTTMEAGDINNDGRTDILVTNKFGAYLFLNDGKTKNTSSK
jgi:hypothetical protein